MPEKQTAKSKKVLAAVKKEMAKPRTAKSARKREDVNQAAARIVRDAIHD